jgi:hypothetical protein
MKEPAMPDVSPDEELRQAQSREYGTFVAARAIDIGGARAFNEGDPVPASHVERGVVSKDDVVKPNTKAGHAAVANNPTTGSEG